MGLTPDPVTPDPAAYAALHHCGADARFLRTWPAQKEAPAVPSGAGPIVPESPKTQYGRGFGVFVIKLAQVVRTLSAKAVTQG